MNNIKNKYLKYKKKYIDLKNKLKGGYSYIRELTIFNIPTIKNTLIGDQRNEWYIVKNANNIDNIDNNMKSINLDLVESLVGTLMGFNTNLELIDKFQFDIIRNMKTFIIDYQNLLFGYINFANNQPMPEFLEFLANFIYIELIKNNKIIIIYKPSNRDVYYNNNNPRHNNPDEMDIVSDEMNPIISSLIFLIDNSKNIMGIDGYSFIKKHININLFVIYTELQIPLLNANLSSNYDDFLFWIISIAFWNIYELFNKTENIFLLTNDSQKTYYNIPKIDNSNDKNIFNFSDNFNIYKTTISSNNLFYQEQYQIGNSYLHLIKNILNENFFSNKFLLSNLKLNDIYNYIFRNIYNIENIHTTYFDYLIQQNRLKYCYDNFSMNIRKIYSLFPPGICFYAFIKYIQYKKHLNIDGAYGFPDMFQKMSNNEF
jgi:hypothetical protein